MGSNFIWRPGKGGSNTSDLESKVTTNTTNITNLTNRLSNYLPTAGGTLTGAMTIKQASGSNGVMTNTSTWNSKNYVSTKYTSNTGNINDSTTLLKLEICPNDSASTIVGTNLTISGLKNPTSNNQAANKQYVDTSLAGLLFNINPIADNTEYTLPGFTYKGNPIYYQYVNASKRISTSPAGLISNVNLLLFQCLSFQGFNASNQLTGNKYFLPYTHTNNVGVVLTQSGTNLQVMSQSTQFQGNYQIAGLVFYTKPS